MAWVKINNLAIQSDYITHMSDVVNSYPYVGINDFWIPRDIHFKVYLLSGLTQEIGMKVVTTTDSYDFGKFNQREEFNRRKEDIEKQIKEAFQRVEYIRNELLNLCLNTRSLVEIKP